MGEDASRSQDAGRTLWIEFRGQDEDVSYVRRRRGNEGAGDHRRRMVQSQSDAQRCGRCLVMSLSM